MKKDIFYPLRRLHGQLHENASLRRRLKNCRVLVPGTPEHGNLGDSAIVLAQMAFLERCGLSPEQIGEVTFSEYPAFCRKIRRFLPKNVLITQLGGGNMGSQWKQEEALHRRLVVDFPRNPMVIFPQTIYYAPDAAAEAEASKAIYGGHKKLTMVAREQDGPFLCITDAAFAESFGDHLCQLPAFRCQRGRNIPVLRKAEQMDSALHGPG